MTGYPCARRITISGTEFEKSEGVVPLADTAKSLQVAGVELWHPQNTTATGLSEAIDRIRSAGLDVTCLSSGIELYRDGGSIPDQRRLLDLVGSAARLGVPLVNTYFGFAPVADDTRAIETFAHLLEPCLAEAGNAVTILLENEFDSFGWDPAGSDVSRRPGSLRQLFEYVGSERFRLTFDPANFVCAGENPLEAYDELAGYVGYVHVKDVRSARGALPGWREYSDHGRVFTTCPLGEGEVTWTSLLKRLFCEGYSGLFNLEPHGVRQRRGLAFSHSLASIATMLEEGARSVVGA
jgi:sugar phosphate isomerase/epimerase